MKTKPFSKKLHKENDALAKSVVLKWLATQGEYGTENPDKYGPDLVFPDFYAECEIKYNWKGSEFPFKTVQFPYRKKKFFDLDKPTTFFMLNADQTKALYVDEFTLKESSVWTVSNKYVPDGEMFFQVTIDNVEFIIL